MSSDAKASHDGCQALDAGRSTLRGGASRNLNTMRRYHKMNCSARRKSELLVAQTPQGARKVGVLEVRDEVPTWVRKVDAAKHMLRLPEPSWAVDEAKLLEAQAAGAERVEVRDELGRTWWTSVDYLLQRGQRFDRGWGRQVRLALDQWSFLPAPRQQPSLLEVG